jgi:hypothetical protein
MAEDDYSRTNESMDLLIDGVVVCVRRSSRIPSFGERMRGRGRGRSEPGAPRGYFGGGSQGDNILVPPF